MNRRSQGAMVVKEEYSGPLPPPSQLEHYEGVLPGAAERILAMAEHQAAHRQKLEQSVISSDIRRSAWGQFLGFIIALSGMIVSGFISVNGNPVTGGLIGFGTLASLVGVFMYGAKSRKEERSGQ